MRRSFLRRAASWFGLSSFARRRDQWLRKLRNRRSLLESLEDRRLMAVFPVANDDPLYNTPLNTTLNSAVSVSANDFEADSHSLTASVVANPSHGTLTSFGTNGQFTYVPTTGYTGLDSFTYKVNNGTYDSNVATVSIAVGGVFGPRTNLDDQPLDSPMYTGANTLTQDLSLGQRLVYRSDTVSLKPVIVVETSLKSGATVPNSIDAVLTFNGVSQGTVSYTNSGLAAGDTLRFALQADATSLATGYYNWSMTITANYTGSTSSTTYSGSTAIVNRTASEYGKGWWLDGLDQLVTSGSGALLVRGNGDTLWFADNSGTYAKAAGDTEFSTLVKNVNNTYTLTTKHGIVENFGTTGLLTSRVDRNSNTWSYAYTDGDGDSTSDELHTITDPYSRVQQTVAYTSNRVSSFTDLASHATSLAYTSGQLTSVTLTDPDGGGALSAPVWGYAYNGTTNLLVTQTDPNSEDTAFTYNSTSLRLSQTTFPDPLGSPNVQLTPVQTYGLKTGTGNALVETVNPLGSYTDEESNQFQFKMDRFGNVIQFGHDFSGGSTNDVTDTYRDASGLRYRVLQAAVGGTRYETRLGYNSLGDLLKIINPDNTTQSWTYDSTFHLVLTATDEMGRVMEWTRDSHGNELTREDNAGNTWTTSYGSRTDGLPVSITSPDPDGAGSLSAYVTGFSYDSYGRLTTTTNPDSSTQVLAYNSANMVTSVTDELSHVTSYGYDALNRLTSITGADPDGAGSLTSPVTSFTYDATNNLLTTVDALSHTTTFAYDQRNRLTSKTLPDPDGAGSLSAPVFSWDYDNVGNMTAELAPQWGDSVLYDYDAYGRLIDKSQASAGKHETWTYDVLGRMTAYTNSLHVYGTYDQTDSYQYDNRGRVTRHTGHDPDGIGSQTAAYETFTYNYAGQPASHTDFLGNVTSYSYTAAGWLNSVTLPDPDGSGPMYSPIYTLGYDALGNQTSLSDPNGHMSTKTWNSRGWLASETGADPDGAGSLTAPTTSYGYDLHGNLTSITNPLSKVTSIGYDNLNRKTSLTLPDPDGAGGLSAPVYAYGYNAVGSLTTETDPLGNVTTTAYDNMQRRTSVTQPDPDGAGGLSAPVWTWVYGSNGLVSRMTDPMSHNTDYGYDTYGRLTTVTNNDGYVTTTAYNLLDQVTSVTTPDPDGAGSLTASTVTYAYDRMNRLASVTDALSGVTSYTYDANSNLINLRDPVNNDTSWSYDNLGQVTMETNELGNTRSYWHDAVGNLTRYEDRNERVTQYTFDDLDRLTAEKWLTSGDPVPTIGISTTTQGGPSSEVQRVGYTSSFAPTSGTFTLSFGGQTTSGIAYNASAATVQAALEGLSSIGSGNVSVTKSQNTSTAQEWTVTFQGTLGGANQSQITIDTTNVFAFGKSNIQATDTQGGSGSNNEVQVVTLSNATDGTFRLAFGGQTTAPIAYNASAATVDSALEALTTVDAVSVTGSNGGPWTVTFTGSHSNTNVASLQGDASTAQSGSVNRTISYTYDTASQLTDISDSDSTYAYTYDNIGRVLTTDNNGTSGVPRVILTNVYDAASNRTSLSATIAGTNDFINNYTYDNLNRMTQVAQVGNGGNTIANKRANFAYNALGQFTSIERQVKPSSTWNEVVTTAFTYDTLNRLTGIDHKRSGSSLFTAYAYTYDHMDRITGITSQDGTVAYTYDKTSQLTGADYDYQTDETFSWDANGNPSGGSNTVGTNNRLTSDGTYNYTYDDEGNLTRKTKISDSSYTDYTYDYRNRLTNVTNKTSGGTSTMSADYTYDVYDRRIKKVVDADGAGAGGSVTSRYVYEDTGYTQVVLQFDGSSNLTHRYLHGPAIDQLLADEDGSNNLLWNLSDHQGTVRDLIDNSGSVQNHLKYSAFGNVTAESASTVDFLMGFAGMDRDEETGANYSWERYAQSGRWLSEDPLGFGGEDVNLKRYVSNSPVGNTDPSGSDSIAYPIYVNPESGPYLGGTLGPFSGAIPSADVTPPTFYFVDDSVSGGWSILFPRPYLAPEGSDISAGFGYYYGEGNLIDQLRPKMREETRRIREKYAELLRNAKRAQDERNGDFQRTFTPPDLRFPPDHFYPKDPPLPHFFWPNPIYRQHYTNPNDYRSWR